jgi:hypothetical protein
MTAQSCRNPSGFSGMHVIKEYDERLSFGVIWLKAKSFVIVFTLPPMGEGAGLGLALSYP